MERSWLETIQSLGLDVQLAIVVLLFALDGLGTLVRRVAAWRAVKPSRAPSRPAHERQPAAADAEAWPSETLPAGGGPAG